jgi:zinc and cadmium transporter
MGYTAVMGVTWVRALVAVGIISAIPLLAFASLAFDVAVVRRAVPALVRLAIGALVGAVLFDLIPDAIADGQSPPMVAATVAVGLALFMGIDLLLHRQQDLTRDGALVRLNFTGDIVHNALDGMLIAASFLTNPGVGIVTTVAVALHELPREFGSFGVFLHGGLSVRRAIGYNALTGIAAMGGAILTLLVGAGGSAVASRLLPVSAGAFLYLAGALLQTALCERQERGGSWFSLVGWIAVGMAGTMAATFLR